MWGPDSDFGDPGNPEPQRNFVDRFHIYGIAVPSPGDATPRLLLVAYQEFILIESRECGLLVFWWDGEDLRTQSLVRPDGPPLPCGSEYRWYTIFLKGYQQRTDGQLELAFVRGQYREGMYWSDAEIWRWAGQEWKFFWSPDQSVGRGWADWKEGYGRDLNFGGASTDRPLDRLTVRAELPDAYDFQDGRLLWREPIAGIHRGYLEVWRRDGDRYVIEDFSVGPTGYTILVEFVARLSRGDSSGASELVTDQRLVERARQFGLHRPDPYWKLALDIRNQFTGPIEIYQSDATTVEEVGSEFARRARASGQSPIAAITFKDDRRNTRWPDIRIADIQPTRPPTPTFPPR
jgi:hypothetical protein